MRAMVLFLAVVTSVKAELQVAWNRTPEMFAGKYVVLRLTNGTRVEGNWASVTSSSFTMKVEKTSDKRKVQRGLQTMPRSSIVDLRVGKRRVRGRILGVLAGCYGAAAIGAGLSHKSKEAQGYVGLAAIAGALGGYLIGSAFDHATQAVVLLPEDR